jgi:hypothetical protein
MKKNRIKVKEGDLFAVPLGEGGYGIGLVTREHKQVTMGYFFKKFYQSIPTEIDAGDINKWEVIFIGQFSPWGIKEGKWPLLAAAFKFDRNEWPIPVLRKKDLLTDKYYAVIYDDTLFDNQQYQITREEADELYEDGYHGHGVVEKRLSELLADQARR